MSRLAQLQKIAQVRETRAVIECQAKLKNQLEKAQACERALGNLSRLREARVEVLSQAWRGNTATSQALQEAVQIAEQLSAKQRTAQVELQQADAERAEAQAVLNEACRLQAKAQRTRFKLSHALDAQKAVEQRALESRMAQRREDDGGRSVSGDTSW